MKKKFRNLIIFSFCFFSIFYTYAPPKTAKMVINSNPTGATVYIESTGSFLGVTPFNSNAIIGQKYVFTFKKDGYKTKTIAYTGGSGDIFVTLESLGPVEEPARIDSEPQGASFIIAGNSRRYTTPTTLGFEVGRIYQISFYREGFENKTISYTGGSGDIYIRLDSNQFNLKIDSNVNRARVSINGNDYGKTPLDIRLSPANYSIVVTAPGYREYSTTVYLDRDKSVYANLERDRFININIPNGAKVYINGEMQNLDWGRHGHENDWNTFTFYSGREMNEVEVKYHGITVKKKVSFDGRTINLVIDLM